MAGRRPAIVRPPLIQSPLPGSGQPPRGAARMPLSLAACRPAGDPAYVNPPDLLAEEVERLHYRYYRCEVPPLAVVADVAASW